MLGAILINEYFYAFNDSVNKNLWIVITDEVFVYFIYIFTMYHPQQYETIPKKRQLHSFDLKA